MGNIKSTAIFLITAFALVFIITLGTNFLSNKSPINTTPSIPVSETSSYTLAQVATHSNASSCWSIVQNNVYDLTSWINQHPGGSQAILSICGKDGTVAFEGQHGGQSRPLSELQGFAIGIYKQ
jgi:cytochrome b involved in lipid metabolism